MQEFLKKSVAGIHCWLVLIGVTVGCSKLPPEMTADHVQATAIREAFNEGAGGSAASDGASASTATPTGWANLKGIFKLSGSAPARATINADKDMDVCAPGGMKPLSEELVVGANGGIKDVLIFVSQKLPDDEPWTHPTMKAGAKADVAIFDQKQCTFLSHLFAIRTSQPMEIRNSDPVGHNTSLKPKNNASDDKTIPGGGFITYQAKKEEAEPFKVTCAIHPWMVSHVIFRNNGYFAVTKEDGTFEIPNLPAGVELEFRVWQERLKPQSAVVNGQTEKWSKGKFKLAKLSNDETRELEMVLEAK